MKVALRKRVVKERHIKKEPFVEAKLEMCFKLQGKLMIIAPSQVILIFMRKNQERKRFKLKN